MAAQEREEAFVSLLDAADEYIAASTRLSEALKKGMFHISQARYAYHGPLGQAQWHAEMEASCRVRIHSACVRDSSSSDEAGFTHVDLPSPAGSSGAAHDDDSSIQFELVRPPCRSSGTGAGLEGAAAQRHTTDPAKPGSSNSSAPGAAGDVGAQPPPGKQPGLTTRGSAGASGTPRAHDPLRWFGVLVPPALRAAQTDFGSAAELVVALANARQVLARATARWEEIQLLCDTPTAASSHISGL